MEEDFDIPKITEDAVHGAMVIMQEAGDMGVLERKLYRLMSEACIGTPNAQVFCSVIGATARMFAERVYGYHQKVGFSDLGSIKFTIGLEAQVLLSLAIQQVFDKAETMLAADEAIGQAVEILKQEGASQE